MDIISSLAERMVKGQSFGFESFNDAKETIEDIYEDKKLYITYDRLSLLIYSHNLTPHQFRMLDMPLRAWLESHNSEDHKQRIEYGILFQYFQKHTEYFGAKIDKRERPDFVVELDGAIIGIEVTRLEKESDSIMSRILFDTYRPGMKPKEVFELAFKKHGKKVYDYNIIESQDGGLAIQLKRTMLITTDRFVEIIGNKLRKYRDKALEFDKFIVLCNAQHGITIADNADVRNLLFDTIKTFPKPNMNIAVLYASDSNNLQCAEYSATQDEIEIS